MSRSPACNLSRRWHDRDCQCCIAHAVTCSDCNLLDVPAVATGSVVIKRQLEFMYYIRSEVKDLFLLFQTEKTSYFIGKDLNL